MGTTDGGMALIIERRKALASRLLGRFARPWKKMSLERRLGETAHRNPVDVVLGFLTPGSWMHQQQTLQGGPADEDGVLGKSVRDIRPGRSGR
jgi:hypothetical protein